MGGAPLGPIGVISSNAYSLEQQRQHETQMQAAAMNIARQMYSANSQSAFNSGIQGARMEPARYNPETEQFERSAPSVARTAASRVRKADWETEEDRKDRELDEWLEASRQAIARSES